MSQLAKVFASAFLLVSMALGQDAKPAPEKCETETYVAGKPAVRVFQRFNQLRAGREEDVAVVLFIPENAYGCCALTNDPKQTGIRPTMFELTADDGLRAKIKSGIRYRSVSVGNKVPLQGQKVILLKLRADAEKPIGSYTLRGKVSYLDLKDEKHPVLRQIDVVMPVYVGAHDINVQEIDWPFGSHVKHNLLQVLVLPVELPFIALLAIACHTGSGCDL